MLPRPALAKGARSTSNALRYSARLVSSARPPAEQQRSTKPVPGPLIAPSREKSWLTKKVEASPSLKKVFLQAANLMGYGSPKQVAGRRAFAMYEQLCIIRPEEDKTFWQEGACFNYKSHAEHALSFPYFRQHAVRGQLRSDNALFLSAIAGTRKALRCR